MYYLVITLLSGLPNSEEKSPTTRWLKIILTSGHSGWDSWAIKIVTLATGNLGIANGNLSDTVYAPETQAVVSSALWSGDQTGKARGQRKREETEYTQRKCDVMPRERTCMTLQVLVPVSSCCPADLLPLVSEKYQPPALQMSSHG